MVVGEVGIEDGADEVEDEGVAGEQEAFERGGKIPRPFHWKEFHALMASQKRHMVCSSKSFLQREQEASAGRCGRKLLHDRRAGIANTTHAYTKIA